MENNNVDGVELSYDDLVNPNFDIDRAKNHERQIVTEEKLEDKLSKSSAWYIAATHYITAGFVIPLLVSLVMSFLIFPFMSNLGGGLKDVIWTIIWLMSFYFGTKYSGSYLKKTYELNDYTKSDVITFSMIYLIVIVGFITIKNGGLAMYIQSLLLIITFYIGSKLNIETNTEK